MGTSIPIITEPEFPQKASQLVTPEVPIITKSILSSTIDF
jgi:hypothetical protein